MLKPTERLEFLRRKKEKEKGDSAEEVKEKRYIRTNSNWYIYIYIYKCLTKKWFWERSDFFCLPLHSVYFRQNKKPESCLNTSPSSMCFMVDVVKFILGTNLRKKLVCSVGFGLVFLFNLLTCLILPPN